MMWTVLKAAAVVGVCLVAAGCQTKGIYASIHDAEIVDVSVQYQSKNVPPSVAPRLRDNLRARFAAMPKTGPEKCVSVVIAEYHLKDPALSLLVGDSNRMTGTVRSVDKATGKVDGDARVIALDTYAINGVIGAVQAASQDPGKAEQALTAGLEDKVVAAVYGSEVAKIRPPRTAAPAVPSAPATTGAVQAASQAAAARPQHPAAVAPATAACPATTVQG
ncbi:hypothetical protein ACSBOB_17060 [Mesorhizobium sp. ASY16-5R]|uniref:hypothetical protein n=1 Tax=Mesorhizobium sp. ASY16-5R TaxID=3445772 RepID=UPI003FA09B9C